MLIKLINGEFYRVIEDTIRTSMGRCYKCDLYKQCTKDSIGDCKDLKCLCHFIKIPRKNSLYDVRAEDFDFSKSKVRYKGQVKDKCTLASLIHCVEYQIGQTVWPLVTDIYWFDYDYNYLKTKLEQCVKTLRAIST